MGALMAIAARGESRISLHTNSMQLATIQESCIPRWNRRKYAKYDGSEQLTSAQGFAVKG